MNLLLRSNINKPVRGKHKLTVSFNFPFAETAILGRCDSTMYQSSTTPVVLEDGSSTMNSDASELYFTGRHVSQLERVSDDAYRDSLGARWVHGPFKS